MSYILHYTYSDIYITCVYIQQHIIMYINIYCVYFKCISMYTTPHHRYIKYIHWHMQVIYKLYMEKWKCASHGRESFTFELARLAIDFSWASDLVMSSKWTKPKLTCLEPTKLNIWTMWSKLHNVKS